MDLLDLARLAAGRAADYIGAAVHPAGPSAWTAKGSRDFVTEVDRTAERLIAETLLSAEPGGRIVGEELTPDGSLSSGLVWIVDPLDGTTNFLHRLPWYAVSIAAAIDGVLEAAVVIEVPGRVTYHAARGGGAWRGAERIAVSSIVDPAFALIATGFPFKDVSRIGEYTAQFTRVAAATSGIRRPGAAALDLAGVAAGHFDGFWEQRLSAWDLAAGSLLVREAGGVVTDFSGVDAGIGHGPIVAGNPAIHRWLVETIGAARGGALEVGGG